MKKNKQEIFIDKATEKHSGFYSYEKVDYKDSNTKVCIICPEHGEFWQTPVTHLRGRGCPECANKRRGDKRRWSKDIFIKRSNEIHGGKYDYSKVTYKNNSDKVCIICPEHGEFWQTPIAHIFNKQGCPKCAHKGLNRDDMIDMFRKVHGNKYDYSKFIPGKMNDKACFICPEHGEFWQSPTKHMKGQGCPKCGRKKCGNEHRMTTEEFIQKAKIVHGDDRYDYSNTIYTKSNEEVSIICPKHGKFHQVANYHLCGHGCPHCGNNISLAETEISSFIESLGFQTDVKNRKILGNGKEIDIYVQERNIGIEYDGLVWHSDLFKDRNYHLDKTEECEKNGIRLIHIFEDEWVKRKDIVKSMLANIFGVTKNKISARQCVAKVIDYKTASEFIEENHLQGKTVSSINLGLFYLGELVSVMTFGKPRVSLGGKNGEYEYEMIRFCSKLNTSVIGGAGKLFSYFVREFNPNSVISYCDRRWATGKMYEMIGFRLDHASRPNYFYIEGNNRKNRFRYNKASLVKMGYDKNKSEKEITKEMGLYRIYDCGTYVYKWKREDI